MNTYAAPMSAQSVEVIVMTRSVAVEDSTPVPLKPSVRRAAPIPAVRVDGVSMCFSSLQAISQVASGVVGLAFSASTYACVPTDNALS